MLKKILFKPYLSVSEIGKNRFWLGLFCGLGLALSLFFFFENLREIVRLPFGTFQPIIKLTKVEAFYYSLFNAAMAYTFGFCFTIFVWLGNFGYKSSRQKLFKIAGQGFSFAPFWLYTFLYIKLALLYAICSWSVFLDQEVFTLIHNYPIFLVLSPIVIFQQSLLFVKLAYRLGWFKYWFALSGIAFSALLAFGFGKNPELINNIYKQKYAQEATILSQQLSFADSAYGIVFSENTINILRDWNSLERKLNEEVIIQRFESNNNLSADSLMLLSIFLKTEKEAEVYHFSHRGEEDFINPLGLYERFLVHKYDTVKAQIYIQLLEHQIYLQQLEVRDKQVNKDVEIWWRYYPHRYYPHRYFETLFNTIYLLKLDSVYLKNAPISPHRSGIPPPPVYKDYEEYMKPIYTFWKLRADSIRASF